VANIPYTPYAITERWQLQILWSATAIILQRRPDTVVECDEFQKVLRTTTV